MAKGFPGNMQEMMKQAQKMQEQLLKAQQDAAQETAEGSSGGGMVTVTAGGDHQVKSISIEKEVVNPEDVEMLQDLILAATNEALRKVEEKLKERMGKITGGLNIPGLSL